MGGRAFPDGEWSKAPGQSVMEFGAGKFELWMKGLFSTVQRFLGMKTVVKYLEKKMAFRSG
jgi:hypothetical protein